MNMASKMKNKTVAYNMSHALRHIFPLTLCANTAPNDQPHEPTRTHTLKHQTKQTRIQQQSRSKQQLKQAYRTTAQQENRVPLRPVLTQKERKQVRIQ